MRNSEETNKLIFSFNFPGICGLGECLNGHEEIECKCKVGTFGKRCEHSIEIVEPYFSNNSFLAYPAPTLQQKYYEQLL